MAETNEILFPSKITVLTQIVKKCYYQGNQTLCFLTNILIPTFTYNCNVCFCPGRRERK